MEVVDNLADLAFDAVVDDLIPDNLAVSGLVHGFELDKTTRVRKLPRSKDVSEDLQPVFSPSAPHSRRAARERSRLVPSHARLSLSCAGNRESDHHHLEGREEQGIREEHSWGLTAFPALGRVGENAIELVRLVHKVVPLHGLLNRQLVTPASAPPVPYLACPSIPRRTRTLIPSR